MKIWHNQQNEIGTGPIVMQKVQYFCVKPMGCPQNLSNGRGPKVNTAAKALPISAARPDPGRRGYAWAAVLTYSPRPFTIFCGQLIDFYAKF